MQTNFNEIITAIENHSALLLAGLTGDERQAVLQKRAYAVLGMVQLAKRLPYAASLVQALRAHLEALEKELAG